MSVRISKVLREFNIGLQSLVDLLAKKGIEISDDPNAKLSDEAYKVVCAESIKDKNQKQTVENMIMQRASEKEKKAAQQKPAVKPVEIKTEVPKGPVLKTVGHVDLNALSGHKSKAEPQPQSQQKPQEAKKVETNKPAEDAKDKGIQKSESETKKVVTTESIATPSPVVKIETTTSVSQTTASVSAKEATTADKNTENKQEIPTANAKQAKTAIDVTKVTPTIVTEIKNASTKKASVTTPISDSSIPNTTVSTPEQDKTEKKDDGIFRPTTTPELAGTKVVGHVDLSAINGSTRPPKKSRKDREKERRERLQAANGSDKKKRNRIPVGKVDIDAVSKTITQDGRGKDKQNSRSSNMQNGKGNKNAKGNKNNKKNPVVSPTISDEDVRAALRNTQEKMHSKTHFGSKYRREKREQGREQREMQANEQAAESKVLKLTEFVTANELASMMHVPVGKVISTCMSIGMMISINQRMDAETINMVAEEFGFKTEYVSASVSEAVQEEEDSPEDLQPRDPIVTVMGHVDHGKTSLLDWIRKTNVIAGEAGGITQHIGAYNVTLENGRRITFLDTPGHEAFTAMRARGAQVTDIAIIIIAADDGVMPQTKEAIAHAQAAGVPMVFAINKIDKPGANPEKVKETLANMNLLVEDWGGKYQSQDISAKKGVGVNELLEKVLLEADMLELKANPNRRGTGTVIESSLDKGRGYVATILVSNGTLHLGDNVIAGTCYGRVKDLTDERGRKIKDVGPSRAATLLGLNGAPQAGDTFHVMETEQEAREIAAKRLQLQREQGIRTQHRIGLEEIGARIAMGGVEELNIIVKGDVDGSVEALSDSLIKLSTDKIKVNVIHKAVGQISENDIVLAEASKAIIIGFQVRPSKNARAEADKHGVDIRLYSVIYDAIEEVKEAMEGLLKPIVKEEVTAQLEVRQVYRISKVGLVAGAYVTDGKVSRTNKARVIRDGIVIFTGDINALKRFKDDVKEVSTNFECGISLVNCNDIREGDIIETFQEVEVKQKL